MASVSFQLNLDSTDDIIVCISPVQEKMLDPLYLNNHDDSTHCMDDYCPPHCIFLDPILIFTLINELLWYLYDTIIE